MVVVDVLAYPLSKIVNPSLNLSVFSEKCKTYKLKLLFKKGSNTNFKIYRPISLLPPVSEIIEKSILYQLEEYLQRIAYSTNIRQNLEQVFKVTSFSYS